MVDLSLFPTASELARYVDEDLEAALKTISEQPLTTLEAIEEALNGKVESWTYYPAWTEGWCTEEDDCKRLREWEPIECRIHARGLSGALSFLGVSLKILFPRCTDAGKCPCGAACRGAA